MGWWPSWTALGAIVVMPEGGSGWYADWWNDGERSSPGWESYELDTVIPTILASYPILPQRQYHAIAGFSMGGLGAVYLAGRLPGFFGTVASLSGFVDPGYFAPITQPGMWFTSLAPLEGDDNLDAVYGPPNGFYSQGHDPANLVANLMQTRVFESTGTGFPSRAGLKILSVRDVGATAAIATGSALELPIIYPMNELYHHALVTAGVDVTYQVHRGGHDIPDFYGNEAVRRPRGKGPVRAGDHRLRLPSWVSRHRRHQWAAVGHRLPLCPTAHPGRSVPAGRVHALH